MYRYLLCVCFMASVFAAEDSPASLAEKGLQELRVKRTNVLTALRKFPDLKESLEAMKAALEKVEEPVAPALRMQAGYIGQLRESASESPTTQDKDGLVTENKDYASLAAPTFHVDKKLDEGNTLVTAYGGVYEGKQFWIIHGGKPYDGQCLFKYVGFKTYKTALDTKKVQQLELYLSEKDFQEGFKASTVQGPKPAKVEVKEKPPIEIALKDGTVLKVKSQIKMGDGKILVTDSDGKKHEVNEADIVEAPKK